jgi:hypothetical protein
MLAAAAAGTDEPDRYADWCPVTGIDYRRLYDYRQFLVIATKPG